jgi:hypothetical protein
MEAPAAATVPQLPLATLPPLDPVRWFCPWGCVAGRGEIREVWIGGTLIGQFYVGERDRGMRNVLLVTLAGDPVHHTGELKAVVDTIRIVCANAEVAGILASNLHRSAEAKKLVAKLLASPGSVQVAPDAIRIRLAPAANRSERIAIEHLLAEVNRWALTLPGDAQSRPLRFALQPS